MKFKKTLMAFCLIMCILFCISSVAAGDVNNTIVISDDNQIELSQDLINDMKEEDNLKRNEVDLDNNNSLDENNELNKKLESDSNILAMSKADKMTGKTIDVEDFTFGDIQKAVDSATEGDTVYLKAGTYLNNGNGEITISSSKNNIFIVGVKDSTILDAQKTSGIFNIYAKNGITIKDIVFINSKANGDGGALYMKSGTVTNCNFIANSASGNGGALYMKSGTVTNCNFIANSASGGGAVYFYDNGTVTNCNFTNNSASGSGGAVYIHEGNVTNCTFINNRASGGYSGAMDRGSAVNCTFINNYGRAMSGVSAVNCTFINNYAYGAGGAMYYGMAVNCFFINNHADDVGGALYSVNPVNCTFINNTAKRDGGAMNYGNAINCTFINNHAYGAGGAMSGGAMSVGTASNCTFINNTANWGGALYICDALYCTFIGNLANIGNAMFDGKAYYCYFGGNSKLETSGTRGTRVEDEIIHASIEITQSGSYYLEKSLTVKLTNLDTNLGVRYEDVKIKFSNGNEITLYTDNNGIATYDVTFNPGTYSVTVAPVDDYIQADSKTLNNLKIEKYPARLKLKQVGNDYKNTVIRVALTNTKSNSGIAYKLIILTFSNGKTAELITDSKGIASYDVPFAPGEYKVTGKVDDIKINETSSVDFKINKASFTIMPTKLTTIYKSGKSFKVKLVNSQTKKPITGVKLTLKVYTGKKFTTHTLTTDNNGYVYLSTDKLGVGSHKVVVTCNNGYCIGNSATSTIKINSICPKLTTYTYKTTLGTLLTGKGVIIKDKNSKEPIKGIKVKFKLYTKSKKYKTYTLTTDSLGKCALFTNKYSVGSHKLIITIEIPKIYKNALNKKYKNIKKTTTINIQSSQKFKLMNNNQYFDILYSNGKVKVV